MNAWIIVDDSSQQNRNNSSLNSSQFIVSYRRKRFLDRSSTSLLEIDYLCLCIGWYRKCRSWLEMSTFIHRFNHKPWWSTFSLWTMGHCWSWSTGKSSKNIRTWTRLVGSICFFSSFRSSLSRWGWGWSLQLKFERNIFIFNRDE